MSFRTKSNHLILIAKTIGSLFISLHKSGQSYLLPLVLVLLTLALLLFGLQVVSPLAPFVYSLF